MEKSTNKAYFVTGIGTDVGKTVVSAILAEALAAHYWKPIQSGDLNNSDTLKVEKWTSKVTFVQEAYRLTNPLSPHTSARLDGIQLSSKLRMPDIENTLIVEGAGGILVPINDAGETVLDLIQELNIPVIVVVKHYLGSINHTLLTIKQLQQSGISIAGLVVSGDRHPESEKIIETISGLSIQLHIPMAYEVNEAFVKMQANTHSNLIQKWLIG